MFPFFKSSVQFGPMIDGGAQYSATGVIELHVLHFSLGLSPISKYDRTASAILHSDFDNLVLVKTLVHHVAF